MPTANEELDRLAAKVGFQFKPGWDDFLYSDAEKAANKAKALTEFIKAKQLADTGDARAQLLSGAALTGAGATPAELATFKPGLPSVLEAGVPAGSIPPATGTPPIVTPSASPEAKRLDELDAAGRANAPAVEAMRRRLALHDAGLDESKIALARVYGGKADEQDLRNSALKDILDNPELDPLLGADIAQNKAVFKSERVKVKHKDGREVYYNATPNMSGGYDYTPALDEKGQPLTVPVSASGGDRPTALQKNAAFVARVLFADDPDAEEKAVTMLTQLKGKSPAEAWASLTLSVSKLNYGRYARDPQLLHDKTAELWRVSRPGEPIPMEAPPPPAAAPGKPGVSPAAAEDPLYQQARDAIAKGANAAAVKARLKALGKDPGKL